MLEVSKISGENILYVNNISDTTLSAGEIQQKLFFLHFKILFRTWHCADYIMYSEPIIIILLINVS